MTGNLAHDAVALVLALLACAVAVPVVVDVIMVIGRFLSRVSGWGRE